MCQTCGLTTCHGCQYAGPTTGDLAQAARSLADTLDNIDGETPIEDVFCSDSRERALDVLAYLPGLRKQAEAHA